VAIAAMSILDITRSLEYMPSFVFAATPPPADRGSAPPAQTCDGLWLRYGGASAGCVALAKALGHATGRKALTPSDFSALAELEAALMQRLKPRPLSAAARGLRIRHRNSESRC
jgi:hypothetical protein